MLEIATRDIPLPSVSLFTSCAVLLVSVCVSTILVYPLRFPSQRAIQVCYHFLWKFVLFSLIPKFEPQPSKIADPSPNAEVVVNIRIEGRTTTLFEGTIRMTGRMYSGRPWCLIEMPNDFPDLVLCLNIIYCGKKLDLDASCKGWLTAHVYLE